MYSEGPISDPKDLGPAIKRSIERVKAGEPALIDVVTQPRSRLRNALRTAAGDSSRSSSARGA